MGNKRTRKMTPCDILIQMNKMKNKSKNKNKTMKNMIVNKKNIPNMFFIQEDIENPFKNSVKNYLDEFLTIKYKKDNIVFTPH